MTKDDMTAMYLNQFSGDDMGEVLASLGFTAGEIDEYLDPVPPQGEGEPATTVQSDDLLLLVPLTEGEDKDVETLIEWGKDETEAIAMTMRRRAVKCAAWGAFFTTFKKQPEARLLLEKAGFGSTVVDAIVEANS